jgi:hypothetical protein
MSFGMQVMNTPGQSNLRSPGNSAPPLASAPKGYTARQQQIFTPEQLNLFKGMFGQVSPESYLGRLAGGDQSQFEQLEAPALRQFAGLQGGIASRFSGGTGAGSLGQRRSSGFYNAQNQAASDFAQQLQAQRMGLQQNAIRDLHTMSQQLLGARPFEQQLIEKQAPKTGFGSFLGGLLGTGLGSLAGGAGAAIGGQLGSKVGGMF